MCTLCVCVCVEDLNTPQEWEWEEDNDEEEGEEGQKVEARTKLCWFINCFREKGKNTTKYFWPSQLQYIKT